MERIKGRGNQPKEALPAFVPARLGVGSEFRQRGAHDLLRNAMSLEKAAQGFGLVQQGSRFGWADLPKQVL
jgi:hypothetical protein